MDFNGLGMHLENLARLSKAETRSISAENPTGEKGRGGMATEGTGAGCARDLGQGWKVSPSVVIEAGRTYTLADIEGPGASSRYGSAGTWPAWGRSAGIIFCAFTGTIRTFLQGSVRARISLCRAGGSRHRSSPCR